MSDEKITFRVDSQIKRQLSGDGINTSGKMRSLAEAYVYSGDAVEVGLREKLKDKERELERKRLEKTRVENDIEQLERKVDHINEKIKQRRENISSEARDFADKIENGTFPRESLQEDDNPAVNNWAHKAGLSVDEFVRQVERELE